MSFLLGHTKDHAALHMDKIKKWFTVSFCNLDIAVHYYIIHWTTLPGVVKALITL